MLRKLMLIAVVAATSTLGTAGMAYADTGAHVGVSSGYSGVNTNQGPNAGHNENNGVGVGHSENNGVGVGHSESNESGTGHSGTGSGSGHGR